MGQKHTKSASENITSLKQLSNQEACKDETKSEKIMVVKHEMAISKNISVFNKKYNLLQALGSGTSARVFLGQNIKKPKQKVAIKIFKRDFVSKPKNVRLVKNEMNALQQLNHPNINRIIEYGFDGKISTKHEKKTDNEVYIVLEYVNGGNLLELCKQFGSLGEDVGRYFMSQLTQTLNYLHLEKQIIHRDLKLENILLDQNLNIIIAEFGFATCSNIEKQNCYRGSRTYIAPEIRENKTYDGRQSDMFSLGVIIFVIVVGSLPFTQASRDDKLYNLIMNGKFDQYWSQIQMRVPATHDLTNEFKDLMQQLFEHDPFNRISAEQIQQHPWMQAQNFCYKQTQSKLIEKIQLAKEECVTNDSN